MNKDQIKGRIDEAIGKVRELAGTIIGNKSTELKGRIEQVIGKTQASYGDAKAQLKKQP